LHSGQRFLGNTPWSYFSAEKQAELGENKGRNETVNRDSGEGIRRGGRKLERNDRSRGSIIPVGKTSGAGEQEYVAEDATGIGHWRRSGAAFDSAGTSDAREEAGTAGAVCLEIGGERAGIDKAAGGVSADGASGFSRECIRGEFQPAAVDGGGAKRGHFCGGDWREPSCRAARSGAYRRSAGTGGVRERTDAAVRDRVPRELCLHREYREHRAVQVRSEDVEAAGRGGEDIGCAAGRRALHAECGVLEGWEASVRERRLGGEHRD